MILLFVLLVLVLLLAILLFTVTSKVNFNFESINSEMNLTLLWLYPLIKSVIVKENNEFALTVYLLNKRIFTKQIKRKQEVSDNKNILRNLNPTDIHVNTQYGFRDPYVTGLTYSAISMISQFFNVESLRQSPDFLTTNDYINLEANAKLNLGNSLMKLI